MEIGADMVVATFIIITTTSSATAQTADLLSLNMPTFAAFLHQRSPQFGVVTCCFCHFGDIMGSGVDNTHSSI